MVLQLNVNIGCHSELRMCPMPLCNETIFSHLFLDCSRFWECRVDGSVCLTECASCPDGSSLCEGKGLLSFDVRYQYPQGPFCDWPSNVDCSTSVCDEMDPRPECCQDSDCQNDDIYPDAYCSTSFNCVYPQEGETTSKPYTVSRFPNFCFPYDGSEIPDCSKYVDPITMYPAYVAHSHSNYENN